MEKYSCVKKLYYTELPNGTLQFNDDYVPFLTYLFAQVGILFTQIKSPQAFERAFEMAEPFFHKAIMFEINKSNNKYYTRAFQNIANGDIENFVEDCQKGNRLSQLRKNTITNK